MKNMNLFLSVYDSTKNSDIFEVDIIAKASDLFQFSQK